jgi:4-deoxy-L-threo-5-hexosulose-uronate ketol-isomerase
MHIRHATGPDQYQRMTTEELRAHFLVDHIFVVGKAELTYWETERTVLGGIVPTSSPILLETDPALAADYFLQRRELGAFNLGGPGHVIADGHLRNLAPRDCLYIGRGAQHVMFHSDDPADPARFYIISYPAHTTHPTVHIPASAAKRVDLGAPTTANERTIFQYIHEGGAPSCQLVTGITQLAPGSIWNTMPPHTHLRRSEVYFYFDIPHDAAAFHFMGTGQETRHLVLHNCQAVLSPSWSIHAGCATQAYAFIWAMGGENQKFTDMDGIKIADLR